MNAAAFKMRKQSSCPASSRDISGPNIAVPIIAHALVMDKDLPRTSVGWKDTESSMAVPEHIDLSPVLLFLLLQRQDKVAIFAEYTYICNICNMLNMHFMHIYALFAQYTFYIKYERYAIYELCNTCKIYNVCNIYTICNVCHCKYKKNILNLRNISDMPNMQHMQHMQYGCIYVHMAI